MNSPRLVIAFVLGLAAAAGAVTAHESDDADTRRTSLRTIEGSVTTISSTPAEGDLQTVTVAVETKDPEAGRFEVLLAPKQVLDKIEFTLEEGDVLRARVFVSDHGPWKAHKVMNMTRGTMVRIRSLSAVPLWDASGDWAGGPCRQRVRYRGGREGRGQGPGH